MNPRFYYTKRLISIVKGWRTTSMYRPVVTEKNTFFFFIVIFNVIFIGTFFIPILLLVIGKINHLNFIFAIFEIIILKDI